MLFTYSVHAFPCNAMQAQIPFYISPGSERVRSMCDQAGLLEIFSQVRSVDRSNYVSHKRMNIIMHISIIGWGYHFGERVRSMHRTVVQKRC